MPAVNCQLSKGDSFTAQPVMFFHSLVYGARSTFSALAVFLGMSSSKPDVDYLFPVDDLPLHIGQWAKLALIRGPSLDTAMNTFVKKTTHYKSRNGKCHEQLLIEVLSSAPGRTPTPTYIMTERGANPEEDRENRDSPISPSSASQSIPPWSGGNLRANDKVFIPGTRNYKPLEHYQRYLTDKNYEVLCTMTLAKPMSLAQLAILMRVVNEHSIHYDMSTYQCYWYAYTIWEIMRTRFEGSVTDDSLQKKRGKYLGFTIRREDSVEVVAKSFEKAWKELCDSESRLNEEEERRIKEAEARGAAREREKRDEELEAYRMKFGPLKPQQIHLDT